MYITMIDHKKVSNDFFETALTRALERDTRKQINSGTVAPEDFRATVELTLENFEYFAHVINPYAIVADGQQFYFCEID